MKKNLTAEQIQKRDARRAKMRELAAQIAKMTEAQRLELAMRCPVVTIEGHALSVKNQCLLAFQSAGVTVVGGFRQWLKAGRVVDKGQHGLSIWIPLCKKSSETTAAGESIDGEPSEVHFALATVFDVSQTVAKEQGVTESQPARVTFDMAAAA
jgi:hypothetical protein